MLENNDFDKLFKDGLYDLKPVDNRDKQWEVVSQRLQKKSRKLFFWLLPLVALIAFSSLYLMNSNNSLSKSKIALDHVDSQNNISINKEKLTTQNENIELNNTKKVINTASNILNENTKSVDDFNNQKEIDGKSLKRTESINLNKDDLKPSDESTTKKTEILDSKSTNEAQYSDYSNNYTDRIPTVINDIQIKHQDNYNQEEEEEEEITTQIEVPLEDRGLFTFPMLNQELKLARIMKRSEIQTKPIDIFKQKKTVKLRIGAGIFYEAISQDSLNDYSSNGFQTNLDLNYSRIHLNLGYKINNVNRVISSNYETYNIVDTNIIYGYSRPDSASVTYTNHTFDLTFGYTISTIKWLDWNIQVGLLAQYLKNGKIKYTYGGTYETIVNEYTFENQGLRVTDFMIGTGLHFNMYKRIGVSLEYNILIPRENKTIKWPRRHQFELGLFYNIN